MTRFDSEFQRLFLSVPDGGAGEPCVRALVIELARPADWARMAALAQGVQTDLDWPAPAVAVNGRDGYQLWWSLAQGVPAAQALQGLEALRRRYLGELPAHRVRLQANGAAPAVPALCPDTACWSAFVAPDLAPVFEDSPGLDLEPALGGQADLLAGVRSVSPAEWAEGLRRLGQTSTGRNAPGADAPQEASVRDDDPRRFLLGVMNDERVELGLRIEAARALLQADTGRR